MCVHTIILNVLYTYHHKWTIYKWGDIAEWFKEMHKKVIISQHSLCSENGKKCTFGAKTESLLDNAPNYLVGCVIKKRLHFLWDFFALWTMNHLSAFRPIWSALIGQLKKHLNPIVTLNGLVKVNLCIQLRIFLHIQLKLKRRRCVCNANGGVIVITQGL